MRYSTVVLSLEEHIGSTNDQRLQRGLTDPREVWIDGTLVATQEAIHYINLLDDGTVVGIAEFRGDAESLATIENELPEVISVTVTSGETWLAYMHYEPSEVEIALLERIDTEPISIDWPIRETDTGLQVTLFGEETALQELIAGFSDEVDVTLERTGEYHPDMGSPAGKLTDRQNEILRTALAAGYYDIPRRATQRDVATELGLSRGTVGEHLRRAEAKLIRSILL
ncbi:helix-turn-helix domain-containing protein [Saliphagus sp. LR7]|uniref:helix-turn-helix domain-containing protein n=1 Tax=Saliphagus sp. LR7 TaxID=2282654 RepID=UPI000DF85215|nr:helix-turn-helix domain-containing protein [Saliphagus sp. LR7]